MRSRPTVSTWLEQAIASGAGFPPPTFGYFGSCRGCGASIQRTPEHDPAEALISCGAAECEANADELRAEARRAHAELER